LKVFANERLLRRIEWTNAVLLVSATVGAGVLFSPKTALGVLLGGIIATGSFQILKWQLRRAFQSSGRIPRPGGLFVSYYLRFLAVLFVIFTIIYYGWANPIALLVGLSLVVLSIAAVGAHEFLLTQVKKGGR
jgi:hypothetical protein